MTASANFRIRATGKAPARLAASVSALALCLTLAAAPAHADDAKWKANTAGDWTDGNNWEGGAAPGSIDQAHIGDSSVADISGGVIGVHGIAVSSASGTPEVNIRNAATVNVTDAVGIGVNFGERGRIGMGAGGTRLSADRIIVGDSGTGELTLTYGAHATANTVAIGNQMGGTGMVTVSHGNSLLRAADRMTIGDSRDAHGSLTISSFGRAEAGDLTLGVQKGSIGVVSLDGALGVASMDVTNLAVAGHGGLGIIDVKAGGQFSAERSLILGYGASGQGFLYVDGAGSQVESKSEVLTIGWYGKGEVAITDGGSVKANHLRIADVSDSEGRITVSGAGSSLVVASQENGFGRMVIGGDGTGSLTVNKGGSVSVSEDITIARYVNSVGDLNIGAAFGAQAAELPGTVSAKKISFGTGTGTLNFNHTSNGYSFGTAIEGFGVIRQIAGTTILTGDSSNFTGGTDVSGGLLRVDGTLGGSVLVSSGAALGGAGTMTGDVLVGSGGGLQGTHGQTLTMGSLLLADGSTTSVTLAGPGGSGLFNVMGDLTLGGTLNVTDAGGYGAGVYRIFDYGGTLTDKGMVLGNVPNADPASLQTSVANQVNLVVGNGGGGNPGGNPGPAPDVQFWNGTTMVANGQVNGGMGTWIANSDTNWTDANGTRVDAWGGKFAVFQNNPDVVTVDTSAGAVSTTGMQFIGQGWTVEGDKITLAGADGATTIRVGDGSAAGASDVAAIASELTGATRLVKDDLGTLILTGANSYAGGTAINAGTLQIGDFGETGAIMGDVVDNGTLRFARRDSTTFAGTISGSGAVHVAGGDVTLTAANSYSGGTTIDADNVLRLGNGGTSGSIVGPVLNKGTLAFNRSDAVSFAGVISGNGTLRQLGGGKLELTGDSSAFSGKSFVEAGTLAVNGKLGGALDVLTGGRLQGTGTVGTTIVRGTIAPGNSIGTLNVAGNISFVAGSIYEVEANAAGQADKIVATGNAAIQGGTVKVLAGAGNYKPQTDYTILTAAGGVNGTFAGVTSNLAFLDPSLRYDASNVYLTLRRNDISFADIGDTPNQIETGGAADNLGWGNDVFDAVVNLSTDQAKDAFDQLSGEIHPSARTAMLEDSRFVRNAVWERLRGAASDDKGGLWGHALGSWGHTGSDGNAARLDRSAGGVLMGVDGATDTLRLGAVWGYSRTDIDVRARGSSGRIDSFHLGAYAGGQWGNLGLRTGVAYAWHDIHTVRNIAFPGFKDMTRAGYHGGTFQAFGELAYGLDLGGTKLEPYANLAYVRAHSGPFKETGGAAKLIGEKASTDATFTNLGLRSVTAFDLGSASATFRAGAGWRHAFGHALPVTQMRFQAGGDAFAIAGVPFTRDAATLDAGLDIAVSGKTTIGLSYSGQIGDRLADHTAKASISFKF